MIWFTSDLHIAHTKILSIGKGRPFGNITEMKAVLIKNWNNKVSPDDDVYVLGDVFWGQTSDKIKEIMDKLNGRKHLILGNHDRIMPNEKSNSWLEIVPYKELMLDNYCVTLCHYPIAEYNHAYTNGVMLHGHTHGTFDYSTLNYPYKNIRIYDVGVDTNNYEPVSWDFIKEKFNLTSPKK